MKLNIVPARTGFAWVRAGIHTFWRQPLALAGLFFMFFAVINVISLIPYIGNALSLLFLPAATLGLMAATREATEGKFPMPSILISAFRAGRQQARAMAVLGGIYVVIFLLLLAVSTLIDGGALVRFFVTGRATVPEGTDSVPLQNALLLVLSLSLPLTLLLSHAPALVHWHGVPPVKSLFFSAVGLLRNIGAILVFLLGWLFLNFVVVFVALLLTVLLVGEPDMSTLLTVLQPVAMLLTAMFSCSIYFTFRDIYVADEPPAAPAA